MNLSESIKSTLMHVVELVVCLAGSWFVLRLFGNDSATVALVMGIAVNALSKFARSNGEVPYTDFVNGEK